MAYTNSKAYAGRGSALSIGGVTGATGGTEVFTVIGEVSKASLGALKTAIIDVTNFQSNVFDEKTGTTIDPGTASVSYNYIAGGTDAGQQAMIAAQLTTVAYDFQLVLPLNPKTTPPQTTKGDTFTFSAIVTQTGELSIDVKDAIKGSAELTITGARNFTAGS